MARASNFKPPRHPVGSVVLATAVLVAAGCGRRTALFTNVDASKTDGASGIEVAGGSPEVGAGGTSTGPDVGTGGNNSGAGENRDSGAVGAAGPDVEGSPDVGRDTGRDQGVLDWADTGHDSPMDNNFDTPPESRAKDDGGSDGGLADGVNARDAPGGDVGDESEIGGKLKLVAGGLGGPGADDGIGTAARFRGPAGLTSDGAGSLFVADEENHTIRRVDIATGAVTTFAGSPGNAGSTDGTGVAARFALPYSVASDGTGNLVVCDSGNNTIRRIDVATDSVSTLAGSPGSLGSTDGTGVAARFNMPMGAASDGAGHFFVADTANHTIRKVDVVTGAVTTLVGSAGIYGSTDGTGTNARFDRPMGVASDGLGHFFVADSGNHTIRQIDIATGTVTTLAGSPGRAGSTDGVGSAAQFDYPVGIASDGVGNLLVADEMNNRIRSVVIATGAVATLAGSQGCGSSDGAGPEAQFCCPMGVASDGLDNLFVTDGCNHTLRKVVIATGFVSTFAGSLPKPGSADGIGGDARFHGPQGLASDSQGNLFVADMYNNAIRRVVVATGAVHTLAGVAGYSGSGDGTGAAARFYNPYAVASDGAGNLFVADTANYTIRKVDIATGAVTTLAGSPGNFGSTDGIGSAARFGESFGVASDGSGSLFVAEYYAYTIRKVDTATGAVTTLAGVPQICGNTDGTGTAAQFCAPGGLVSDGSGHLFVTDTYNSTIRRVDIATGTVTTLAGSAGSSGSADGTGTAARFDFPFGISSDHSGNLFVADYNNHAIRKIVIATQAVTTVVGSPKSVGIRLGPLPASLACPWGLALGPSGELLIADECENAVVAAWF